MAGEESKTVSRDSTADTESERKSPPLFTDEHDVEPASDAKDGVMTPAVSTRKVTGVAWVLVVMSVLAPLFLFALDNTIVADVQEPLVRDLGETEKLPWVSVAFALGAVSVNLIWGKIYGQFDAKLVFMVSIFFFEVGSAVCGPAPNMDALIVGRAICGFGGSGLYLGVINLLSAHTTESERPAYLSLVGITWGLGTVLGPIIGGAFADSAATWRWAFYINLCVGAAIAPVLIFLLPKTDPRPGVGGKARINEVDLVGAILIMGAFVSGIMAISFGGAIYDWGSGQIIGLFVCSAVLWIVFGLQQGLCLLTSQSRRLFPVEMLKSYEMIILFALTAASITTCFLPIYFIPLYLQFAVGKSALSAAVDLLPFVFVLVFAVIFNGIVMGKTGYYMPWYLSGGVLITIGGALMYTVGIDTSIGHIYGYSVLIALGTGFFSQASFPVAQGKVSPSQIPAAVAFIGCAQIGGMAIALSVSNTIFLNLAITKVMAVLPNASRADIAQALSGVGSKVLHNITANQQRLVLDAIASSIRSIYIMVITAGALSVILSVFMKREKLFAQKS